MGQEKIARITLAIFIDLILSTLIFSGAWFIDKIFFAPLLIIVFRIVRIRIEKDYKVLHFATMTACILVSFLLCIISLIFSFGYGVSIISYILTGGAFGYITWLIEEHIALHFSGFNPKKETKENIIKRCKDIGVVDSKAIEIADLFAMNAKEYYKKYKIEPQSYYNKKRRYINKLK